MSKFAGELIAAQLEAERARKEMPEQLDALRLALTDGDNQGRVVVLIDELDRCHPDYAITLLEAMKLVFDRPGYVFVLMVNSEHLERIAAHRFVGWHKEEAEEAREPYLDKFVDMRLKLPAADETIGEAARALAMNLPEPEVPFGEGPEFTIERAAQVAAHLAPISGLSMRQIKRVLLRIELAVRTYQGTPMDVPLLVWQGFESVVPEGRLRNWAAVLPRSQLRPHTNGKFEVSSNKRGKDRYELERSAQWKKEKFISDNLGALVGLPDARYRLAPPSGGRTWHEYHLVLVGLGTYYYPEHQAMLDAVHQFAAD
jgi:hypothetical protein